jgi:nitroimidazol reductase NimA-like FMN-containing flavoprotein (pyridoxamine 5'-phosphate oxidase superfamily)
MQRTARTTVRRYSQRGVYNAEKMYTMLDASFLCHVGFVQENQPFVIPTLYVRVGEQLYLHGSRAAVCFSRWRAVCLCALPSLTRLVMGSGVI